MAEAGRSDPSRLFLSGSRAYNGGKVPIRRKNMAKDTSIALRSSFIYQIFVRDYSASGDFKGVTKDLDRIKGLGADIIHLLPIHPIGKANRKGSIGSPYAIQDYTKIDPAYGDEKDLSELLAKAHALGMRVLMDVVYNHTSPDSELFRQHPEWFYMKDGKPGNKVGDWWDVIDLDYVKGGEALEEYLIGNLINWARFGFDGFRCDVASLVPVDFWLKARERVSEAKGGCIWLAESVHGEFVVFNRRHGFKAASDSELFQAFDICYDYDIHGRFHDCALGKGSLRQYIQALRAQEYIYPENYVKARFSGNHDQERPAAMFNNRKVLEAWTAFSFFNKGTALVYMGEETLTAHRPSLFEKEDIDWTKLDRSFSDLIAKLASVKKLDYFSESAYFDVDEQEEGAIVAFYELGDRKLYGIFKVGKQDYRPKIGIPDGSYRPLAGCDVRVTDGKASLGEGFAIFEVPQKAQ